MTEVQVPEKVQVSADALRQALEDGGRAEVTVRSKKTGAHVYVTLSCKKRKPDGPGYLSRGTKAGRVGLADADKIDAADPDLEFPDNQIGAYGKKSDRFYPNKGVDPARVWAADHVIAWALGAFPMLDAQADVFLATKCCSCGKKLKDPVSVARGVGPECYGQVTGSKKAPHQPMPVPAPEPVQGDLLSRFQEIGAIA
jgi:hypothetical protein